MLSRRYPDGVVAFDPIDGRTYSYPVETFEIIEALAALIRPGVDDVDALERAALRELGLPGGDAADTAGEHSENLRRWAELALRLDGR